MSVYLGMDAGSRICRTVLAQNGGFEVVKNRYSERPLPPVLLPQASEAAAGALPFVFSSLKQELGSLRLIQTALGVHGQAGETAAVLGQLREDVASAAGAPAEGVVIAIPGFYPDNPRATLRDAALTAGFDAVRLYDEALAAVAGAAKQAERGLFLVYALGAGVFSAGVILCENGAPRMLAAEGDRALGGTAFDVLLAERILARIRNGHGAVAFPDPRAAAVRLQQLAENVKIGLSRREQSQFDVNLAELAGEGATLTMEIERGEFEELIAPAVERSIELARTAMEHAQVTAGQIEQVVLVGDSTRIPLVERRLGEEFAGLRARLGEAGWRVRSADADIARGAAWFAGQVGEGNWKRREPAAPLPEQPASAEPGPVKVARRVAPVQEPGSWMKMFAPYLMDAEEQWNSGQRGRSIQTFEAMMVEAAAYLGTLHHMLGQMLFQEGNYDRAIDVLRKAARYTPRGDDQDRVLKNYHEALNHRAMQLLDSGRLEEARIMIDEALVIVRDCPGCRALKSRIMQAIATAGPFYKKKKRR
ncbi:MAG: Hsp70 family protein [Terracidiphilus sp.]